jgi:hypothetical protein
MTICPAIVHKSRAQTRTKARCSDGGTGTGKPASRGRSRESWHSHLSVTSFITYHNDIAQTPRGPRSGGDHWRIFQYAVTQRTARDPRDAEWLIANTHRSIEAAIAVIELHNYACRAPAGKRAQELTANNGIFRSRFWPLDQFLQLQSKTSLILRQNGDKR